MELITRLRAHYAQCPPRLSYGGSEGKNVTGKVYPKWPDDEVSKPLGAGAVQVWSNKILAIAEALPIEGYCVVDACLDETGRLNPEALPLWPEMEGHELSVTVYVDMYDRILMRAIGGFTSHKTRNAVTYAE